MSDAPLVLTFEEADPEQPDLLGGKGAGLARMVATGMPVPAGFVITTEACRAYMRNGVLPSDLESTVRLAIDDLQRRCDRTFGAGPIPLLVSVRSGAPVSMPGMMDTILNLGISREAAIALAETTGDVAFVVDLTRRFLSMYSEIVLGAFGDVVDDAVADVELEGLDPASAFDLVWEHGNAAIERDCGELVPSDPWEQLTGAIEAVLRSWGNPRARTYREHHGIAHDMGTAVVVQRMVFGNLGERSGTGVVFTRDPITGEPVLFGEYLESAQGEDVVSGVADPEPIAVAIQRDPALFEALTDATAALERIYGDALDIEFTVERGDLHLLQVRKAKRTPEAAIRIAADLIGEGVDPGRAVEHVGMQQVRELERPTFEAEELLRAREGDRLLATGIGASPGQVSGSLAFDSDRAVQLTGAGEEVVLVRPTTSPQDLRGMLASVAIVTARGGATSHAAVVARALAKPCIVGSSELAVEAGVHSMTVNGQTLLEGDIVSVDGTTGELFRGAIPSVVAGAGSHELARILDAADLAAGAFILGKATTADQVAAAFDRGAHAIISTIDNVLATTGAFDSLVASLEATPGGANGFEQVTEGIHSAFVPLFRAMRGRRVHVRAIDFLTDEAREYVEQTRLLGHVPQLTFPLGWPEFLVAQVDGLLSAATEAGHDSGLGFAVRHITDVAEASALCDAMAGRQVNLEAYITSPRGVAHVGEIVERLGTVWIEVNALQAAVFGVPARQLLTAEPFDGYVKAGMISVDPRKALDPATQRLLRDAADVAATRPDAIGLRLPSGATERLVEPLYTMGFRRFGVDVSELRPLRLALGRAAWAGVR